MNVDLRIPPDIVRVSNPDPCIKNIYLTSSDLSSCTCSICKLQNSALTLNVAELYQILDLDVIAVFPYIQATLEYVAKSSSHDQALLYVESVFDYICDRPDMGELITQIKIGPILHNATLANNPMLVDMLMYCGISKDDPYLKSAIIWTTMFEYSAVASVFKAYKCKFTSIFASPRVYKEYIEYRSQRCQPSR